VSVVEDLAEVVGVLEATAAATRQAVGNEAGARSLGELRLKGDDPVDLGPAVVICAAPADAELLRRLSELGDDPASGPGGGAHYRQRCAPMVGRGGSDGVAEVGPLPDEYACSACRCRCSTPSRAAWSTHYPPETDQERGFVRCPRTGKTPMTAQGATWRGIGGATAGQRCRRARRR